jgi:hypothetical protein
VTSRPRGRAAESGIVRGCCLLFVLLAALIGGAAYFADRALAAPDLGAPPGGADDGATQQQIALTLGTHLVAELIGAAHGAVLLSEHDLTVLARAHNPHPDRYKDLTARVRNGLLVLSGADQVGPFSVTPVMHISLALTGASASSIALHVQQVDVGQLTLPGFLADRVTGGVPSSIAIDSLFSAAPALAALSDDIECVVVRNGGVSIGIHRPAVAPDPSTCAAS